MGDNVFKFRTLKWGDPERKLKMLSDEPVWQGPPWIEISLIGFIAVALAVCAYYLI